MNENTGAIPAAMEAPPTSAGLRVATPPLHHMAVRFTGSGSEYFRIWIVNLLLTIVTLGLYYPFAKVRRLRYFYANTLVGDQPLGFHGNPWKMLRGYLLVGALALVYVIAGQVSPVSGLIALVLVAALWPALLQSSVRFRLANTSWRGLRFRFTGSLRGAYAAVLPAFVPALLLVALGAMAGVQGAVAGRAEPPGWLVAAMGLVPLAVVLVGPWLLYNLKRYQHDNYALGQWRTELRCGAGPFYVIALKTLGVVLLAVVIALVAVVLLVAIAGGAIALTKLRGGNGMATMALIAVVATLAMVLLMLAMQNVAGPYFTSRLQNLLWSRTGNRVLRFRSALRFRALLAVTLINFLLVPLTLGLYWPFARVALARVRLEAVSVSTRDEPGVLVAGIHQRSAEAAGDAAGDLFGIDIGL